MKKIHILLFSLLLLFFFLLSSPFFIKGYLPIPSDTIIGLYYPFRDFYSRDYPRGIPFKNFLLTDPIRQQYPWKNLGIELLKKKIIPIWNPYSMAGYPLLANLQGGLLYPLNIFFFILPFPLAWSYFILSQFLIVSIGMYLYLSSYKIRPLSILLGTISFSLSGFFIAWFEWGNIGHTLVWFPYILYCIRKIFLLEKYTFSKKISFHVLFIVFLVTSFLAGHIQTHFYILVFSLAYVILQFLQVKSKKSIGMFIVDFAAYLFIISPQFFPLLQLVSNSARGVDQNYLNTTGWFMPWKHIMQLFSPDFFGNPSTLNYWGEWNYAEFLTYVGVFPLIMAFYSLWNTKNKEVLFYWIIIITSFLFILPAFFAKLPFVLNIPFLSTSQPTRLIILIDFALSVLAAFGIEMYMQKKKFPVKLFFLYLIGLILVWLFLLSLYTYFEVSYVNVLVSRRNMYITTFLIIVSFVCLLIATFKKFVKYNIYICVLLLMITFLDLSRVFFKFTPFTLREYLFPQTKTIQFLKENIGNFRIASLDKEILPPNFSVMYKIQSIEGYDPLYLKRYAEYIVALERNNFTITPPYGFNRIITPHNVNSPLVDLLGVKYVLSLSPLNTSKFKLVFQEGTTKIYENKQVLPRVFFVEKIHVTKKNKESIEKLFTILNNLKTQAVVEDSIDSSLNQSYSEGKAEIVLYTENKVRVKSKNNGEGFLILTDMYYPNWKARIDNISTPIYFTDYMFRGIVIPPGEHTVEFEVSLF